MNTLIGIDDGLTNSHYNWADIWFLIGIIAAALAALAYVFNPPVIPDMSTPPNRYYRYGHWAAALVAFAVASIALGLFLL